MELLLNHWIDQMPGSKLLFCLCVVWDSIKDFGGFCETCSLLSFNSLVCCFCVFEGSTSKSCYQILEISHHSPV